VAKLSTFALQEAPATLTPPTAPPGSPALSLCLMPEVRGAMTVDTSTLKTENQVTQDGLNKSNLTFLEKLIFSLPFFEQKRAMFCTAKGESPPPNPPCSTVLQTDRTQLIPPFSLDLRDPT
jgi:hypothetical protein